MCGCVRVFHKLLRLLLGYVSRVRRLFGPRCFVPQLRNPGVHCEKRDNHYRNLPEKKVVSATPWVFRVRLWPIRNG